MRSIYLAESCTTVHFPTGMKAEECCAFRLPVVGTSGCYDVVTWIFWNYFEHRVSTNLTILQLIQHAKESVAVLLKDSDGSFEDIFIKKLSPHLYYDQAIR